MLIRMHISILFLSLPPFPCVCVCVHVFMCSCKNSPFGLKDGEASVILLSLLSVSINHKTSMQGSCPILTFTCGPQDV